MSTRAKLATVLKCGQVWEAEIVRERLESAGIRAFVQGGESATSLSYVGVALGGVRVQVPDSDLIRAKELLAADELQHETAGPWKCPRCDEPNEAGFDLCYSCSMPRGDTPSSIIHPPPRATFSVCDSGFANGSANEFGSAQSRWNSGPDVDPYLTSDSTSTNKIDLQTELSEKRAEASIARAMRWTVIGLFVPMPLFHIISLSVLAQAGTEGAWKLESLRRKAIALLVLDVLVLVATVWFLYAIFT
jgi:hypothetical protein